MELPRGEMPGREPVVGGKLARLGAGQCWDSHPGLRKLTGQQSEVKVAQLCPTLRPCELYSPWNSPGLNTGVGSLSLLQGIFPPQGSNPGLPRCRQILYQLSHQGSPRMLEWVACPFSSGSSCPGMEPASPVLLADSLPAELHGKP